MRDQLKVASFGQPGSFTHQASDNYFKSLVPNYSFFSHFEDVVEAVETEKVDFGVLPIENSSTGGITEVYDLLRKGHTQIIGEKCLRIEQNLLCVRGASLESLRRVYSHPQGLAQCKAFFRKYPHIELIADFSTSQSAKVVSESQDVTLGAVAGLKAAELYELDVLVPHINSESTNQTRFVVIAKKDVKIEHANKITLVFSVKHEPGSLYSVLGHFYHAGLNVMNLSLIHI